MRAPEARESVRAVATDVEVLGADLEHMPNETGVAVGWHRSTRLVIANDTQVRIEWPTSDLFDVRVGSQPPLITTQETVTPPPTPPPKGKD
jgi:hypothetical protein